MYFQIYKQSAPEDFFCVDVKARSEAEALEKYGRMIRHTHISRNVSFNTKIGRYELVDSTGATYYATRRREKAR